MRERGPLAYVFWHRAATGVDEDRYRDLLAGFHRRLSESGVPKLRGTLAYRIATGVPWLPGSGPVWEDWYLMDDSSVLDDLDQAAVSGPRRRPHDEVAALAGEGAGGLYRLRAGSMGIEAIEALWMKKPGDWSYERLWDELGLLFPDGGIWGRQMVLGPAPEICVRVPGPVSAPGWGDPSRVQLEKIVALRPRR